MSATTKNASAFPAIRPSPNASGAVHVTMHVASATDAEMLFAPSRDGISYSPHEWADWDDCAAAMAVLAGALAKLV